MKLFALHTTVATRADAQRLADVAVARSLAACVQITPIESVYRWQGALQHESELRLLFKTTEAALPALQALLLEMHPYELPALYAVAVDVASPAYRDWVLAGTTAPPPAG